MTALSTQAAGEPMRSAPVKTRVPMPAASTAAWSLVLVLGYVALDLVSSRFWIDAVPFSPWNPQAGLAVGVVLAWGLRYAGPLFAAALACEWLRQTATPGVQALLALNVTFAYVATGLLMRRLATLDGAPSVAAVRDFLLIAAGGAVLASLLNAATYAGFVVGGVAEATFGFLTAWLGTFAGMLVVTPLVVLLLAPWARDSPVQEALVQDAGVFFLTLAAVTGLICSVETQTGERLLYLLFVPLIVLAMRRGFVGAALGIAVVQAAILVWLWLAGRHANEATDPQLLMVVLGVTTLVLGAVAGERHRALAALARRSSELREQQQALTDAMRSYAASATAATLLHEMSQPLSAIGSYAHALLSKLRSDPTSPADLTRVTERIVAESVRVRGLVQRIRDFFRADGSRREAVDLRSLIGNVVDGLHDRLRAGAIKASVDVPYALPRVSADPVQLGIVLHNLVGNAVEASADRAQPRWVRIRAQPRGAYVEVEVADSGPGIDPSLHDALFEPLATTKPAGMGLGLSISRTLVAAHGGQLELASATPTTFRFTLPTHDSIHQ